ncbi:hypothetical protein [Streptomyces sp. NPDC057702]|uniref:hypothetical protein n=1 Tax=unclassified Streptomyces TaxID=2593676 RepID=UPI0036B6EF9C
MARQTWVHLLVWRPVDPGRPLDVSRSWPRVLQVTRGGRPAPPGVLLRPGEPVPAAAARVATALGLHPPARHRVLAVDQYPAESGPNEELSLILDGGWLGADTRLGCDHGGHAWSWTPVTDLGRVALVHALRTVLADHPPLALWQGMPVLPPPPDSPG